MYHLTMRGVPVHLNPTLQPGLDALSPRLGDNHYSRLASERIVAHSSIEGTPSGSSYLEPEDEEGAPRRVCGGSGAGPVRRPCLGRSGGLSRRRKPPGGHERPRRGRPLHPGRCRPPASRARRLPPPRRSGRPARGRRAWPRFPAERRRATTTRWPSPQRPPHEAQEYGRVPPAHGPVPGRRHRVLPRTAGVRSLTAHRKPPPATDPWSSGGGTRTPPLLILFKP